jgi:hypothetical protein
MRAAIVGAGAEITLPCLMMTTRRAAEMRT